MTKSVIEMAREAGFSSLELEFRDGERLERFAALVREDYKTWLVLNKANDIYNEGYEAGQHDEREKQQELVLCPCCGKGHLETEEYCNSCGSICSSPKNVRENNAAYKATIEAAVLAERERLSKKFDEHIHELVDGIKQQEREACAKVCDESAEFFGENGEYAEHQAHKNEYVAYRQCAAAIRARNLDDLTRESQLRGEYE